MEPQALRKVGLRVTGPRLKILKLLECSARHLTVDELRRLLVAQQEDVGLATIYRVLTQLESANLVCRHNFEGGQAVFELNRGFHHDHLVCLECGRVTEFLDEAIEERQRQIAGRHDFVMEDHSLVIYGRCRSPCESGHDAGT